MLAHPQLSTGGIDQPGFLIQVVHILVGFMLAENTPNGYSHGDSAVCSGNDCFSPACMIALLLLAC